MSQSSSDKRGIECDSYKKIAKLTSDLLWEWDLKTHTMKKSVGSSEVFSSFRKKDIPQVDWWENRIHPDDRKRIVKDIRRAIQSKHKMKWHGVYRFLLDDNSEVWVSDTACIIRNSQGKAQKLIGAMRDITQRIKTEEMLRSRLSRQLSISELSRKALSENDIYQLFQLSVDQLREVLQIDAAKVLELMPDNKCMMLRAGFGWNKKTITHNTIIEKDSHSQAAYALKSKKPVIVDDLRTEKRVTGPNMLTQHKIISGMSVILCRNEGTYGVLSVHTKTKRIFTREDIDYLQSIANIISLAIQRNETEGELRKAQSQFKALHDANIIGVMYERMNGSIVNANDAFLNMLGYTRKEFEKRTIRWEDITPAEYERADLRAFEEVSQTGIAYPYEKEYFKKDGGRVSAIVGAVMLNRETEEVLAFALDITARKELERKKDEFMSIASHELRTPLTSIKGYTQILERIIQQMGDQRLHTYLKKTNTYVERLNSLIVELLDVSKIQAGKLVMNYEAVDFDAFIEESIESIRHFSSRHSIVYHGRINEVLRIDRNRLEQVLTNLITNAIKYSPNGNKVEVQVKKEGNSVVVSITDEGIGISKKDQKNLFNRFYRVESSSNSFSGLGIGLYISREIINRHGGKIWATSKKGEGSTFSFSLPLQEAFLQPHIS
ncbi:PAS domain-containing protein [Candidatus Roizmanbacteria bacterium]|nr:MAG: PAS domain-containing protein [Candidatus Roizmanbacteria bacterium]